MKCEEVSIGSDVLYAAGSVLVLNVDDMDAQTGGLSVLGALVPTL